jgi:hypothetical protein
MFDCYYCNDFHTNLEEEYRRHEATHHLHKPMFPYKADIALKYQAEAG